MMHNTEIKVDVLGFWGDDRAIAQQAWASTYDLDKHDQRSDSDVDRVVRDVVRLAHGTPKERVWVDFAISCPIACERQIDKQRMCQQIQDIVLEYNEGVMGRLNITQNELSGRYRTIPARWLALPDDVADIVQRGVKATCGADGEEYDAKSDFYNQFNEQHHWYQSQLKMLKQAQEKKAISNAEYKRSREVLRMVLGTGFFTDMRLLANLRTIEILLEQRAAPDAQPESQTIARRMFRAMTESGVAPIAIEEIQKRLALKGIILT